MVKYREKPVGVIISKKGQRQLRVLDRMVEQMVGLNKALETFYTEHPKRPEMPGTEQCEYDEKCWYIQKRRYDLENKILELASLWKEQPPDLMCVGLTFFNTKYVIRKPNMLDPSSF